MTIAEAIKHAEEVAENNEKRAEVVKEYDAYTELECLECAENHRQLAEWLKELQQYRELFDSPEEAADVLNMSMI